MDRTPSNDPLLLVMRDCGTALLTEVTGLRDDIKGMRKDLHELTAEIRAPAPAAFDLPEEPEEEPEKTRLGLRMWSFFEQRPMQVAGFLLLLSAMFAGGPEAVDRVLDYVLGEDELAEVDDGDADAFDTSSQPIGIEHAPAPSSDRRLQ